MAQSSGGDNRSLQDLLNSTLALLRQFTAALSPSSTSPTPEPIENPPDPLKVLSDSAKLAKAHTTKISLLAINKPFTPSAIISVVKQFASTCLPAMMSAVQICEQEKARWSGMMCKEVEGRVRRVLTEFDILLTEVLSIAQGNQSSARRDSLSSTGVVWESCDALTELEKLGIAGLALQKAQQYRDTIQDAISELHDWAEGDDLDTEGRVDGLLDPEDEGVEGDKDSIDDIFNAANSMPSNRPELKALAEEADEKLKKVVIVYKALEKRRIKTFQVDAATTESGVEARIARLDELMLHLKRIPHIVDEMASYLYDLDEDGSKTILQKCLGEALSASESMRTDWAGHEDAFTAWLEKWKDAVS